MEHYCYICPRHCRVDRRVQTGVCKAPQEFLLARASLHHYEEPCLSGWQGSGAVFFSGCNLGCVFCQNASISQEGVGKAVSSKQLRFIFERLTQEGAHNINLVTPTHYTEALLPLLDSISLPVVWNSSAYEEVETLKKLSGKVNVFLPDFKYADHTLAKQFSMAPDYPDIAKKAIWEMVRQVGNYQMKDGLLTSGVLIRHLILPGHLDNTFAVIDWVADTFKKGQVLFSLMSQYTPYRETEFPELNRRLTKQEWIKARNYMKKRGITEGYVQDLSSAKEEYTPAFDFTGLGEIDG